MILGELVRGLWFLGVFSGINCGLITCFIWGDHFGRRNYLFGIGW